MPLIFPVSREFGPETDAYETGPTTTRGARAFRVQGAPRCVVAHAFYFAVPLAFWGLIPAVEPHPAFARLYLAMSMALVYSPAS
jgi:hypothetical protein